MSNATYQEKEEKRMALEDALRDYQKAAESDGLSLTDMAKEIEDAAYEADINITATPA